MIRLEGLLGTVKVNGPQGRINLGTSHFCVFCPVKDSGRLNGIGQGETKFLGQCSHANVLQLNGGARTAGYARQRACATGRK